MIRARLGSEICEKLKKNVVSPKTAQFSHDSGLNCRPIRGFKGKLVRFPHCSFVFRGKSYFFCGFTYPLFSPHCPAGPPTCRPLPTASRLASPPANPLPRRLASLPATSRPNHQSTGWLIISHRPAGPCPLIAAAAGPNRRYGTARF